MTGDVAASAPWRPTERDECDAVFCTRLFDELREASCDGVGITRECFGASESRALDIVEAHARAAGLATERDAGANLVVTLEGTQDDLPCIACGSHLDSVPQGGNYDGAAGVVAGLAVLAGFKADGVRLRRTLKLFGLRGEESAFFGRAYLGSSALFGRLTRADLAVRNAKSGRSLGDCMRDCGIDVDRVSRGAPLLEAGRVGAWLELHIEQGPLLIARDHPVGIVTGLRGNIRHRRITCVGAPGHSGAIPRELRRDAVFATADLIMRLDRHWQTCLERGLDVVMTCGIIETDAAQHAIARIPGTVAFSFEARSQNADTLEAVYGLFLAECAQVGAERGVAFKMDRRVDAAPAVMDAEWIERLRSAARKLGLPDDTVPSGAGHDAAIFAGVGIASAMIFVRNQNGSHNPAEAMEMADFSRGLALMRAALLEAAQPCESGR